MEVSNAVRSPGLQGEYDDLVRIQHDARQQALAEAAQVAEQQGTRISAVAYEKAYTDAMATRIAREIRKLAKGTHNG